LQGRVTEVIGVDGLEGGVRSLSFMMDNEEERSFEWPGTVSREGIQALAPTGLPMSLRESPPMHHQRRANEVDFSIERIW